MFFAARFGHLEITAIDYARKYNHPEIIEFICEQIIKKYEENTESSEQKKEKEEEKIDSSNYTSTLELQKEKEALRLKLEEVENELTQLKNQQNKKVPSDKLQLAELIWSLRKECKSTENCFVDDEEEKYHKYIEKVGEGATSITYKVVDTRTGKAMCKKVLKVDPKNPPTIKDVKNIIKEFEILIRINHPCICNALFINTQEVVKDANVEDSNNVTIAIFLEFLEFDLKNELKRGMNNTLKTRIVVEISHALNYLHQNKMIHRDLKIENIMLKSVYQAKLVDFGLVRIHEYLPEYSYTADSMTKGVGTLAYMSPEMLNEEEYDYKTDVYSFGVLLYVLFTGNVPKQSMKDKIKGKAIEIPEESSSISDFCIKLIKKCMAMDPGDRSSFEEILNELRENEYALASSIDKLVIHERDMELSLFEAK